MKTAWIPRLVKLPICKRMAVEAPPGRYIDVPASEYHAWAAVSNSLITKLIDTSPKHVKGYLDTDDDETTPEMRFGTNAHTALFEPEEFRKRCSLGPINPNTKKPYGAESEAHKRFVRENPGLIVLGAGDAENLAGVVKAIREDEIAIAALNQSGDNEVSYVWKDNATGLLCKTRIDREIDTATIDLKTTSDCNINVLNGVIARRGYHRQAAMHRMAHEASGCSLRDAMLLFVESEPTHGVHGVNFLPLTGSAVHFGRVELAAAMSRICECILNESWPGHPSAGSGRMFDLPKWKYGENPWTE